MEKIDICNAALIEAHQDATITNIDEASPEAERCRRIYDSTRRELLSMYPWNFSNRFVKLARVKENVNGYKYAYLYPADALRINGIFVSEKAYKARNYISFDFAEAVVADVDGKKCILCDYESPFVCENIDITKEEFFPENFCRLLYLYMALKITKMAGVGDDVRKEIRAEISEQASITATVSNKEELQQKDEKNYYVDVRG